MKFDIWSFEKKPLPEILSFIVDNRGKTVPTTENGHILIATNCIKNENLYPSYEKIRYLSEETYQNWFRAHPKPGDILFVCKGTPGRVCMVPDPIDFCIAQDMVALRANEAIVYNKYLLAVLRSARIQKQIEQTSVGDVIPHFKKSFFNQLLIPIPPMQIQRIIGDYYFVFSEKVEINKKINDNLQQQAKALYKDWFLDFSPFSSDGTLPEGWRIGTVGDIIQLHDSKRVPLSGTERSKMAKLYPYYGATSLMDYVDNYLFDGIYLLLGEDGTVVDNLGFPILQYVYGRFWVNNHAHIITGKEGFSVEELYLFFSLTNIKSIVTGAVQQKVSQQNLKKVPAIIPSSAVLSSFDELIQPIFSQLRNLRDENARLTSLRDTLLPKLMSGEFDVSAVEI